MSQVVICGAAVPMEEKVRLFNEKTKGFIEVSKRGTFVSARNVDVNLSKFSKYSQREELEHDSRVRVSLSRPCPRWG